VRTGIEISKEGAPNPLVDLLFLQEVRLEHSSRGFGDFRAVPLSATISDTWASWAFFLSFSVSFCDCFNKSPQMGWF